MSRTKTLFMETTEISPEKTAGEITSQLISAGATQIASTYENQKIVGLRWTMKVRGIDALFQMPARIDPIYILFCKRKWNTDTGRHQNGTLFSTDLWQKAERVAWRQLLRWVQAQTAMMETGMVEPMEVFQAYFIPPGQDRTLFQIMMDQQFKMLPAPEAR